MTDTLLFVLLIAAATIGTLAALTTVVIRGDGTVGPGPGPMPPRSHPDDAFSPYLLDRRLQHR